MLGGDSGENFDLLWEIGKGIVARNLLFQNGNGRKSWAVTGTNEGGDYFGDGCFFGLGGVSGSTWTTRGIGGGRLNAGAWFGGIG